MTATLVLIGHRGSPRTATENTMASFGAALASGLDALETDVQRTADGELVLHHDPNLAGGHHITAMTLGELRVAAPHVPLVGDLVALLQDYPEARLNLELKAAVPHEDGRADDLCEELARWPRAVQRRVWLSTFERPLLRELERGLAARDLDVALAFLLSTRDRDGVPADVGVSAVHPHHSLVSSESVAAWHAAGLAVHTWTVNETELAVRLVEAGVDGLIGDLPDVLLAAREA